MREERRCSGAVFNFFFSPSSSFLRHFSFSSTARHRDLQRDTKLDVQQRDKHATRTQKERKKLPCPLPLRGCVLLFRGPVLVAPFFPPLCGAQRHAGLSVVAAALSRRDTLQTTCPQERLARDPKDTHAAPGWTPTRPTCTRRRRRRGRVSSQR